MIPRSKRDAVARWKRKIALRWKPQHVIAPALPRERWVKAVGTGSLVLAPLSLAGGIFAAWPSPPHSFQAASAANDDAAIRLNPQHRFGLPAPHRGVGVSGVKAKSSHPSAAVVDTAASLAHHKHHPAVPPGELGIPGIVLEAYQRAQNIVGSQEPGCQLPWWLVAGIGKVESNHADNGMVYLNGDTIFPILGPALDGTNGFAYDPGERAEGPMQFLPSTWEEFGGGGNIDNVFDAALAAGRYLCASAPGGDLSSDPVQQADAVFAYNPSDSYVTEVLNWAYAYSSGAVPGPSAASAGGGGGGGGGRPGSGGSRSTGSGSGRSGSHGSGSSGSAGSGSGGSGSTGSGTGASGTGGTSSGGSPSPAPAPTSPAPAPSPAPTDSSTSAPAPTSASSTG